MDKPVMTKKKTRAFVDAWNLANGFPTGENTPEENMRFVKAGIVTRNS